MCNESLLAGILAAMLIMIITLIRFVLGSVWNNEITKNNWINQLGVGRTTLNWCCYVSGVYAVGASEAK